MIALCPDCHSQKPERVPTMFCLHCDRTICQQCSRAHPGAIVAPEDKADEAEAS
jgi:hypothetical protein